MGLSARLSLVETLFLAYTAHMQRVWARFRSFWCRFGESQWFSLYVVSVLGLSLGQVLGKMVYQIENSLLMDYWVYREAVQAWMRGEGIYNRAFVAEHWIPFNYPPVSLPWLLPWGVFPEPFSSYLMVGVTFGALFATLYLVWQIRKILYGVSTHQDLWLFLLSAAFVLQSYPVKLNGVLGQVNAVVLSLVLLALLLIWSGKWWRSLVAGLLLVVAASMKLYPLFLLPSIVGFPELSSIRVWMYERRRHLYAAWIFLGVFTLVVAWTWHWGGTTYWTTLVHQLYPAVPGVFDQSLYSFWYRLGISSSGAKLGSWVVFLFLLLLVWWNQPALGWWKTQLLVLALTAISGPFVWQHHFLVLIPLFLTVWSRRWWHIIVWWVPFTLYFSTAWWWLQLPVIANWQTLLGICLVVFTLWQERIRSAFFPREMIE